jgi:hypothetical protein
MDDDAEMGLDGGKVQRWYCTVLSCCECVVSTLYLVASWGIHGRERTSRIPTEKKGIITYLGIDLRPEAPASQRLPMTRSSLQLQLQLRLEAR